MGVLELWAAWLLCKGTRRSLRGIFSDSGVQIQCPCGDAEDLLPGLGQSLSRALKLALCIPAVPPRWSGATPGMQGWGSDPAAWEETPKWASVNGALLVLLPRSHRRRLGCSSNWWAPWLVPSRSCWARQELVWQEDVPGWWSHWVMPRWDCTSVLAGKLPPPSAVSAPLKEQDFVLLCHQAWVDLFFCQKIGKGDLDKGVAVVGCHQISGFSVWLLKGNHFLLQLQREQQFDATLCPLCSSYGLLFHVFLSIHSALS